MNHSTTRATILPEIIRKIMAHDHLSEDEALKAFYSSATGALDSKTGRMVMDLFHRLNREQGKTIVLITHNQELAAETSRVLTMRDGILYTGSERGAREDGTR